MLIHETIAGLRAARAGAGTVALVPTMGNLHEGHIALMTQARAHADQVIATIFVNRLQFRPGEDFEKYPRTFEADCEKMAAAGVEHVFAPGEAEMYPQPQTYHVDPPSDQAGVLDGEFRPGHFRGVATVVMKLFQIAQADVALFGKKDYQQLMVIRNLVREFNLPLEIVPGETVRAADGLALSSRNGYLDTNQRAEAPQMNRVLRGLVEVPDVEVGVEALEVLLPAEPCRGGDESDRRAAGQKVLLPQPLDHVAVAQEVDALDPGCAVGDPGAGEQRVHRPGDPVDGGLDGCAV